jgi:hypothetical protein
MGNTLEDAIKKAFADKGEPLPSRSTEIPKTERRTRNSKRPPVKAPGKNPKKRAIKNKVSFAPKETRRYPVGPRIDPSVYRNPKPQAAPQDPAPVVVTLERDIRVNVTLGPENSTFRYRGFGSKDARTQCVRGRSTDARVLTIGIDLGTSSTKVVVGDPALDKAFAVPFGHQADVSAYLLPCRLSEDDGEYRLGISAKSSHRDLKLSFLANPKSPVHQRNMTAFLACVIRHTRSWLLTEHEGTFAGTKIYWKLILGYPAAYHFDGDTPTQLRKMGGIGWQASLNPGPFTRHSIQRAEERYMRLLDPDVVREEDEDIEISVVPEIAAQIYGFVNSSRFDPKGDRTFLMVDVGAGTIDSSLFYINKQRGNRWNFGLYTSCVGPYGVMNLHRHRVKWWLGKLQGRQHTDQICDDLKKIQFATDRETPIPENFSDYVLGTKVEIANPKDDPDHGFFNKILTQVREETYWKAGVDGMIAQDQLRGIPAFYCGGGIRMLFYAQLLEEMRSKQGYSWLKAEPRAIELPKNLVAPGLVREDFDRLTVAYGLSFVNVGEVTKVLPPRRQKVDPEPAWQVNYPRKEDV